MLINFNFSNILKKMVRYNSLVFNSHKDNIRIHFNFHKRLNIIL